MTYLYYRSTTWNNNQEQPQMTEEIVKQLKHLSVKKNWRIVQLPNGYYQTECRDMTDQERWLDVTRRETIESAEAAIDGSIDHYIKKLDFMSGPKVVKTF
jgi:hypothetical protein